MSKKNSLNSQQLKKKKKKRSFLQPSLNHSEAAFQAAEGLQLALT